MGKLTAKAVQYAGSGMHADGDGLYLQVKGSGASWILRYKLDGRERYMGLGSVRDISLSRARELAAEAKRARAEGVDPVDLRKEKRAAARTEAAKAVTFADYADRYIAAHEAGWKNPKHRWQWRVTIDQCAKPVLGPMSVSEIDTAAVMRVLTPIWHLKPETASRLRGRIEVILDSAKVEGLRQGENPARWRGHIAHLLPSKRKIRTVRHHSAIPWQELPALMAGLRHRNSLSARALEFLVLTATRASEACGARWDEIDLKTRIWKVPASRMKGGKEHRVPLAGRALEILLAYSPEQRRGRVFPGLKGGALTIAAVEKMLSIMGRSETVHGMRSAFKDWATDFQPSRKAMIAAALCGEIIETFPSDMVEVALAHAVGNAVEQAYRRTDMIEKRRRMMQAWDRFCTGTVDE